jgi:signal peptidase I
MTDLGVTPKAMPSAEVISGSISLWSASGAHHWLPVSGQSMWPFLNDGDRVLVAWGRDNLRPGDLLVYQVNGRLVIHRLIEIRQTPTARRFITCGDNVRRADPPVYAPQIVGPVVAAERGERIFHLRRFHWRLFGRGVARLQRIFLKLRWRL